MSEQSLGRVKFTWRSRLITRLGGGLRKLRWHMTRGQNPCLTLAVTTMRGEIVSVIQLRGAERDHFLEAMNEFKTQKDLVQR